jgi:nicotinate-nucleotide pyrophosphorylase
MKSHLLDRVNSSYTLCSKPVTNSMSIGVIAGVDTCKNCLKVMRNDPRWTPRADFTASATAALLETIGLLRAVQFAWHHGDEVVNYVDAMNGVADRIDEFFEKYPEHSEKP